MNVFFVFLSTSRTIFLTLFLRDLLWFPYFLFFFHKNVVKLSENGRAPLVRKEDGPRKLELIGENFDGERRRGIWCAVINAKVKCLTDKKKRKAKWLGAHFLASCSLSRPTSSGSLSAIVTFFVFHDRALARWSKDSVCFGRARKAGKKGLDND